MASKTEIALPVEDRYFKLAYPIHVLRVYQSPSLSSSAAGHVVQDEVVENLGCTFCGGRIFLRMEKGYALWSDGVGELNWVAAPKPAAPPPSNRVPSGPILEKDAAASKRTSRPTPLALACSSARPTPQPSPTSRRPSGHASINSPTISVRRTTSSTSTTTQSARPSNASSTRSPLRARNAAAPKTPVVTTASAPRSPLRGSSGGASPMRSVGHNTSNIHSNSSAKPPRSPARSTRPF